jgi:O-antigen/teichoic acid export membrane protein
MIGGTLVAITIPLSYYVVPVLFGDAYRSGQVPLVILLAATAVSAAAAPLHPLYLALARDRALALVSGGAAGLNLVANLLVIPPFGMTGAASTTLAAQVALLLFFWFASVPRQPLTHET